MPRRPPLSPAARMMASDLGWNAMCTTPSRVTCKLPDGVVLPCLRHPVDVDVTVTPRLCQLRQETPRRNPWHHSYTDLESQSKPQSCRPAGAGMLPTRQATRSIDKFKKFLTFATSSSAKLTSSSSLRCVRPGACFAFPLLPALLPPSAAAVCMASSCT